MPETFRLRKSCWVVSIKTDLPAMHNAKYLLQGQLTYILCLKLY